MAWLNYQHLLYFYTVAREGTVVAASKALRLSPSTISDQIRQLEQAHDTALFRREGRRLQLTEAGQIAYRYAGDIFERGQALLDALAKGDAARRQPLRVGIADVLPKMIAWRLLAPVLELQEPVRLVCTEDRPERLVADLALHRLDVVLSDAPLPTDAAVRGYSHLLGTSRVALFGTRPLVRRFAQAPPQSLHGAPLLLPTRDTALRSALDLWFESAGIRPRIVAEIEDSALLRVFAQHGQGLFAAPVAIAEDIERQHHVSRACDVGTLEERFYAITAQRRLRHPGVVALSRAARDDVFAKRKPSPR